MANREDVYAALDSERAYQDACQGNAARETKETNRDAGSLLTLMDVYLEKAKVAFAGPSDEAARFTQADIIRKVTALGVLFMERNGAPQRAGFEIKLDDKIPF